MHYWLHRISYLEHVSYPLFDKGYLSIGFSDLCHKDVLKNVASKKDWDYFENAVEDAWGEKPKNRYFLWRFLAEMKKGDYILVPTWDSFQVVQVCDDLPILATDESIDLPESDWYEQKISRDKKTGFLKLEGEKDYLDIGYLRKVKIICKDIPRSEYADSALTSRMKFRGTTANINDLEDSIKKAITSFKKNKPINLKTDILEKSVGVWSNIILDELNPDKYEKLVKWYFDKSGASETYIPPKASADKVGDVDIIATFENLKTIIYVQVKFYKGETSEWAVEQIKDFGTSKKNEGYDGYSHQYWVISSSDNYSDESHKLASKHNIILIDGKEFVKMLHNVGLDGLESFEE